MNSIVLLLLSSLIISCSHYSPIYWGWGEWTGPDLSGLANDSVAGLDWSKLPGVIVSIDGNSLGTGYKKARLLPGKHVIEYAYYTAQFGAHPKGTIEMDLKAGHLYEFGLKLCFWCNPRKYAVWVDDNTTGELVWGKRPEWPSWYL
jgi:hypothetical protein